MLPALPLIAEHFGSAPETVQLTLSAFFIAAACGQLVCGALTDRFGRAVMLGVEVDRAVIGSAKHLAPVALKERRIGGALDVSYRLWAIDHLLRLELTRSFR